MIEPAELDGAAVQLAVGALQFARSEAALEAVDHLARHHSEHPRVFGGELGARAGVDGADGAQLHVAQHEGRARVEAAAGARVGRGGCARRHLFPTTSTLNPII